MRINQPGFNSYYPLSADPALAEPIQQALDGHMGLKSCMQSIGFVGTAPANEQSGFILIYVVGLLAAIAIILLEVGRTHTDVPLYMEKQLNHQIQFHQERILLDFIISGTQQQSIQDDPRYIQFKRILAANPNRLSDMQEELNWLKSALAQFNFNIDAVSGKDEVSKNSKDNNESGGNVVPQPVPQETLFRPRKNPYQLKVGQTEYAIRILPSNALPNLNALTFEPLWRYLFSLKIPEGEARELAAAIIDWRDEDSFKSEGIGAESEYYYGMKPPYSPPNAPIRTWQELNFVRGMDPAKVKLFRDNFVLGQPGEAGVSPDYASPEILSALTGLKLEIIKNIMREYGMLGEKNMPVGTILLSNDAKIFENAISWNVDLNLLRIQIVAPNSVLTADYDSKNRRIIGWW